MLSEETDYLSFSKNYLKKPDNEIVQWNKLFPWNNTHIDAHGFQSAFLLHYSQIRTDSQKSPDIWEKASSLSQIKEEIGGKTESRENLNYAEYPEIEEEIPGIRKKHSED